MSKPVAGAPIPVTTSVDENGSATTAELVPQAGETLAEAVRRTGTNRFRYTITESSFTFAMGEVQIDFIPGSFKNADVELETDTVTGASNEAFMLTFAVEGATAALLDPGVGGGIDVNVLNFRAYIDVRFLPAAGASLDDQSVLDASAEFTLGGPGAGDVAVVDDVPEKIAETETFRVEVPTAALADPMPGDVIDREMLNERDYIDVVFTPTGDAEVDVSTLDGTEFVLSGADGENIMIRGPPTQPGELAGTNTFRYQLDGQFDTGQLTVSFVEGSWSDPAGNRGAASSDSVIVVTQASSFFIELSGGIELRAADFFDEPLFSVTAETTLEIDSARKVIELSFSGQLTLIQLGTVGATAGRFVLDLSGELSVLPQFWGVMRLETNFSELEQIGVFISGEGTLMVNTTAYEKTETLTLPGIGANDEDVTRTFELPQLSFMIELVGWMRLRPPGLGSDLFRMQGGFLLQLNPEIPTATSTSRSAASSRLEATCSASRAAPPSASGPP